MLMTLANCPMIDMLYMSFCMQTIFFYHCAFTVTIRLKATKNCYMIARMNSSTST